MAAYAIIASSDSSEESVGSTPSRVILFVDIPTVIPSISMVAPETSTTAPVISFDAPVVEMTIVASPTRLYGLVPYSDSDSDSPDEMDSLEYITPLPATLLFLYTNSFEASDSFDGPPSQDPYAITIAHWRSRVTACSSSSSDFPIAPVTAPPGTHHRPSSSSLPMDSSPVHSSGLDAPESSSEDSSERPLHSSSHFSGPSHKRCRSPTNFVPSSTPVTGSLARTHADILPPHKRFRDSYSPETSMEEDTEIDNTETEDGRELDTIDGDDVRDHIEVDPRDDREELEASAGDTVVLGIDRRIVGIETTQRQLEADQMIASGASAGMTESIRRLRLKNLKVYALLCIKRDRVDSLCLHMSHSQEEFRQVHDDRDDLRRKLRRLESFAERRL
uniref:Uncharacterized protein n=1 Tax=Tanacetum cinerariifolium TaxID=118510 RepID=A0A6L2N671_TANCI|nr:hypothetical protein [Tanacetum cinerariifolium]